MRYGAIKRTDIANGPGVRVSLFVSGCRNHCFNCFNPETWSFSYGDEYTQVTEEDIIKTVGQPFINGFSVLGGDPFEPENLPMVTELCKKIKVAYPEKTIWVYTGYLYENLKDAEIFNYIDVLVDGPFIEDLKDITLTFRGSSNQRLIDIPATIANKQVTGWTKLLTKTK